MKPSVIFYCYVTRSLFALLFSYTFFYLKIKQCALDNDYFDKIIDDATKASLMQYIFNFDDNFLVHSPKRYSHDTAAEFGPTRIPEKRLPAELVGAALNRYHWPHRRKLSHVLQVKSSLLFLS